MDPTVTHQPQHPELDAALASYLQAIERGEQPDRAKLLADHPQFSEELKDFFHDQDQIHRLTRPVASNLGPGSVLGSYRIVREIGRGGMGIVYEAIHEVLKKRVALKLLPLSPTTSGSHLERFLREAQTAAAMHHTNIVPVFDVGQVDGLPFYAMQFIEGMTLDKLASGRRKPPEKTGDDTSLSPESHTSRDGVKPPHSGGLRTPLAKNFYHQIANLGKQAALGLAYAHERGVIHRDIKPSNLILDEQGTLWITDFGLAKRLDDATLTVDGQLLGTPRYMSPEQASAAKTPVDHRTDIYSLGVTLYEILVGRPAHDGKTPPEVVNQILNRDPVSPRRIDSQLPRDLETVVMKAMAKAPADRYGSATELATDLELFVHGDVVHARRIGAWGKTWRWAKREPQVAGLLATIVAVTLLGLLISLFFNNKANQHARSLETLVLQYGERLAGGAVEDPLENTGPSLRLQQLWLAEPLKYDHADADLRYRALTRLSLDWRNAFSVGPAQQSECWENIGALWVQDADLNLDSLAESKEIGILQPTDRAISFHTDPTKSKVMVKYCLDSKILSASAQPGVLLWASDIHGPLSPKLAILPEPDIDAEYTSWYMKEGMLFASINASHDKNFLGMAGWRVQPLAIDALDAVMLAELETGHQFNLGRYVVLSRSEAELRWKYLRAKYPEVFTVSTDECLSWHLQEDWEHFGLKQKHLALFACNLDCKAQPASPFPVLARARVLLALQEHDKAALDFATAWKLGGTGWVKSECRRMTHNAWRALASIKPSDRVVGDELRKNDIYSLAKLQIAATYLEQDPRTMCVALLGKPPLHRIAIAVAKQRLGMEWDERDRQAMRWLLP